MSLLKAALAKRRSGSSNKITFGITASAHGASSSSKTCTTTAATTGSTGSDFFVVATWYNSTTAPVISDSKSNTWTQVGTNVYNSTDQTGMAVFRCLNGTGGSSHTFTMTSGAGTYVSMCVIELKNTNHTIDQTHQGTAAAGTTANSGNITTTNANDCLLGFCYLDSESSSQALSATTLSLKVSVSYGSTYLGCGISAQNVTATTTQQASFSGSPNASYMGALITSVESS
jgi:hypothetical protein